MTPSLSECGYLSPKVYKAGMEGLSQDEKRWIREIELSFDHRNRESLLLAAHKLVKATECRLSAEDTSGTEEEAQSELELFPDDQMRIIRETF